MACKIHAQVYSQAVSVPAAPPPPLAGCSYGDEQHLEEALDKIFRFGKQGGLPRRLCPTLVGLREEVMDGAYTLVLEFEAKLEEAQWQERQPKIQSFFGPGEGVRLCNDCSSA